MSRNAGPGAGTYVLLAAGMAIFGSGTPISKIVTDAFPARPSEPTTDDRSDHG